MKIIVEINYEGKCKYCRFCKKYSNPYQYHPCMEKMFVCTAFYDKSIGNNGEDSLTRLKECIEAEVKEER